MNSILNNFLQLYLQNPIGQTIGIIAFVFGLIAFLNKEDKKFYIIIVISNLFWIIHFSIIGLGIAALANTLNLLRNVSALKFKRNIYIILLFLGAYVGLGVYLFQNIYSTLPIIGGIFGTLAVLYLKGIHGRILLLFASGVWLIYSYVSGSIGGMISEAFMMSASLITISRLLIDKYKDKKGKKYLLSEVE